MKKTNRQRLSSEDKILKDAKKFYQFKLQARSTTARVINDNFFSQIDLSDVGFEDSKITGISLPLKEKSTLKASGSIDLDTVFSIQFLLGLPISAWIGKKILDEIYTIKIRPALVKTFEKFKDNEKEGKLSSIKFFDYSTWYEVSQVMVTIRLSGTTVEYLIASEKVLPAAIDYAVKWLEINGISKKFVTFIIHDGQLSTVPIVSDKP